MSTKIVEIAFPSTLEAMRVAVEDISKTLDREGVLPVHDAGNIDLCIEEAIVNAIVHGNKNEEGAYVRVTVTQDNENSVVRVYDEGRGFDVDTVPCPDPEQLGGRGLMLIKYFMRAVHYNCHEHCLVMTLPPTHEGDCGHD